MQTTIRQSRVPHAYPSFTREQRWAVIQTDTPDYMPASSRQVWKLVQLVRQLRDEITSNAAKTRHVAWDRSPGTEAVRQDSAEARFSRLADAWRHETQFCPTLLEIVTNPNYQQIIGMGRSAIPFILAALAKEPAHWFWALKAITTEDPVAESDRGDLDRMTQTWLLWGARNGYPF